MRLFVHDRHALMACLGKQDGPPGAVHHVAKKG
ncbi:hypothetical protein EV655_11521 [Rhodovulum euryhalinum]|uniref:Uncharacterized protein n=1 Tax=Rhodovulum euryhalinum TaxID=35805 RepID=A0A4R2KB14_9RHOB|nr:hypothetical protein EV655_11521 [Rhodovulum euryhalinum]